MIPVGKYVARAIPGQAQLVESSQKQTPGVQVVVEIIEGEHAGSRLRWDGWLTDATEQRTLESLRLLGWTANMLDDLAGLGSTEVQIVVEHEQAKDGKSYPRIKWINRRGGSQLNEERRMPQAAARALAQRFAAKARGLPRVAATSKPAAVAAQGEFEAPPDEAYADEDVPF